VICNGNLQYLSIIKKECTDIFIVGANAYRDLFFVDFWKRLKNEIN
jgi:hypothetical protein